MVIIKRKSIDQYRKIMKDNMKKKRKINKEKLSLNVLPKDKTYSKLFKNAKHKKLLRNDVVYKTKESIKNMARNKILRNNFVYRDKESIKNRNRNNQLRSKEDYQERERLKNIKRNNILRSQKDY